MVIGLLLAEQPVIDNLRLAAPVSSARIYADEARNIDVHLAQSPQHMVVISSHLPAGWTFKVDIDGDQNGVWGAGHNGPDGSRKTSSDLSFGQDTRNGVFCSQYVFSSIRQDPSEIYVTSECGGMKSKGRAILTGFDDEMRATLTLEIPADEFFGSARTARIRACVWDTKRWNCQHPLPHLLELKRS
jgi:hypothetical protein